MSFVIIGCSKEARDQYGDAGKDVGDAAQKTGDAVVKDTENTKIAAENTLLTSKVTSALSSASGLVTKDINVDSDTKVGTITLNGSVPEEKQREQAETIAKGIAGTEFKVINNLKIVGA